MPNFATNFEKKPAKYNEKNNTFVTGVVRLNWPALFAPDPRIGKYSAQLIIDGNDINDLDFYRDQVQKAFERGVQRKWNGKAPSRWKDPIHDGDESNDTTGVYQGNYYFNAKSSDPIPLFDENGDEVVNAGEIYSGCYVRAVLQAYAYDNQSKGVSFALLGVMKVADGESLGNGMRPVITADAFNF